MSLTKMCIGDTYRLECRIGKGSHGVVYLGRNINNGESVGIKVESRTTRNPKLELEYMIYQTLAGGEGIPNVHWFGRAGEYNVLVVDILGPSLRSLHKFCNSVFTLKTILLLADQLLSRVEYVHSKNFIHRDLKPSNIVMGLDMEKLNQVFLIDFGLAKRYRDPKTGKHIPCIKRRSLIGSARFASINAHLPIEQSRRDDLESLGFVLVYFALGKLPWQGIKASTKTKFNNRIMQKKINTPIEMLCKHLPSVFDTYLTYCRALVFDEKPAYNSLRQLFRYEFIRRGYSADHLFDFMLLSTNHNRKTGIYDKETKTISVQQPDQKEKTSSEESLRYNETSESSHKIKILKIAGYV